MHTPSPLSISIYVLFGASFVLYVTSLILNSIEVESDESVDNQLQMAEKWCLHLGGVFAVSTFFLILIQMGHTSPSNSSVDFASYE